MDRASLGCCAPAAGGTYGAASSYERADPEPAEGRGEGAGDRGIALQPVVQYAMLRLGHPDPGHVFLICALTCVGMAFVLGRMLPELWPWALQWTRLRQRTSV